ncbi:hypothetical protein IGI37_003744 [Enterococcus sp. AZ194]|uniref:acyltransferase family protein n=1 Tax=Enterococcus sp. AZ194 TaxID=2774629 RepID=UPI003F238618
MKKNYPLLDIYKYLASISVILVHCGRLVDNELLHYFFKSTFARLAVPLFILSSSYFIRKKMNENPQAPWEFMRKQGKSYLFWSTLYLPYGIYFLTTLGIPYEYYPIGLLVALVYFGTCYHLWYFPALFVGLSLTNFLIKKINYVGLLIIAFLFFSLGATETYSSFLSSHAVGDFYTQVKTFIMTNRNGLFYSFIFSSLGYLIADYDHKKFMCTYLKTKLCLAIFLLVGESWLIFYNQGDDKNFLFSSLPLVTFLFLYVIHSNVLQHHDFSTLRLYSKYLFFLHPIFLEISKAYLLHYKINVRGIVLFFITYLLTTLFTALLIFSKKSLRRISMQTFSLADSSNIDKTNDPSFIWRFLLRYLNA